MTAELSSRLCLFKTPGVLRFYIAQPLLFSSCLAPFAPCLHPELDYVLPWIPCVSCVLTHHLSQFCFVPDKRCYTDLFLRHFAVSKTAPPTSKTPKQPKEKKNKVEICQQRKIHSFFFFLFNLNPSQEV